MPDDCAFRNISGVSDSTFTGVLKGPGLARKSTTMACAYRGHVVADGSDASRRRGASDGVIASAAANFANSRRERSAWSVMVGIGMRLEKLPFRAELRQRIAAAAMLQPVAWQVTSLNASPRDVLAGRSIDERRPGATGRRDRRPVSHRAR